MDKLKGVAKGGWHPGGDRGIHRDTWKSDLKGMATGKKNDPYQSAREHQSTPLSSLKDPSSFGPPPKHTGAYGSLSESRTSTPPPRAGADGATSSTRPAPPASAQRAEQEEDDKSIATPSVPYRANTTGLRTDNLPKPPVRRADGVQASASPGRTSSPSLPPRQPPRQSQPRTGPPPILPPRQNEYPDEHSPAPPPTYQEATYENDTNAATINSAAASRLGRAGVSVPGFDIGPLRNRDNGPSPVQVPQLSELQARFARMNTGAQSASTSTAAAPSSSTTSPLVAAAAQKKPPPPPPPPKKAGLSGAHMLSQHGRSAAIADDGDAETAPPPIPLGSKPRPS